VFKKIILSFQLRPDTALEYILKFNFGRQVPSQVQLGKEVMENLYTPSPCGEGLPDKLELQLKIKVGSQGQE
jgi:hypothetical protein